MADVPFLFDLAPAGGFSTQFGPPIQRRLSAMQGQFLDSPAYEQALAREDALLYEVYEVARPQIAGELMSGISIVHPGVVGQEYFMTKGHFHSLLETAEMYYCLSGEGRMVMETPEGQWAVERLCPGRVLYVPPRWAHRTINTGEAQDVVSFFVYPANAGHDYGTIERQGFRKLVVRTPAGPQVVDNPRWSPQKAGA